jgi:hypothetical protein
VAISYDIWISGATSASCELNMIYVSAPAMNTLEGRLMKASSLPRAWIVNKICMKVAWTVKTLLVFVPKIYCCLGR